MQALKFIFLLTYKYKTEYDIVCLFSLLDRRLIFFSSLVVFQVKRTADTLLATVQGVVFFSPHKTLHCASFL